jgi:hypothetical protein
VEPVARPDSFDATLQSDWSVWVLDHDMPRLPASAALDTSVPIARWIGPEVAAVLHVRYLSDGVDGGDLDSDVEVLIRRDTRWEILGGSGGTGWFSPPFVRPELPTRSAEAWFRYEFGSSSLDRVCALYGVAGKAATTVELTDSEGTRTMAIESPVGAWVAATRDVGSGTVQVLDAEGVPLLSERFAPAP